MNVSTRLILLAFSAICLLVLPARAEKKPAGSQPHPPTYYQPQLLASVPDAAEKIQFLAPHIRYGSYNGAGRVNISHTGVQLFFSDSGVVQKTQYFWSWTGGYNAPVSVPYQNSASFSLLYSQLSSLRYADGFVYVCTTANACDMLTTPDVAQDHMLMDALLTLAVASGNPAVAIADMAWDTPSSHELKKLKLSDARVIKFVDFNTPGFLAGIHPGDILTGMEGIAYHQNIYGEMARRCLMAHPEGCTVPMDALRNGQPIRFEVAVKLPYSAEAARALMASAAALAAQNSAPAAAVTPPAAPQGVKLGIRARTLTGEDAQAAKLGEVRGIYVQSVDPGGLADAIQLRAGDILLEIDGAKIANMDELRQHLGKPISTLTIWRAEKSIQLQVPESL